MNMASDQNPKMDKLLRDYAKKRRDEAGAPSEMHAATRKMLQAEISRTVGKQTPDETKAPEPSFWQWSKLLWAGAASACVIVIVFALAPVAVRSKKHSMQLAAAKTASMPQPQFEAAPAPMAEPAVNSSLHVTGIKEDFADKQLASLDRASSLTGPSKDNGTKSIVAQTPSATGRSVAADSEYDKADGVKRERGNYGNDDPTRFVSSERKTVTATTNFATFTASASSTAPTVPAAPAAAAEQFKTKVSAIGGQAAVAQNFRQQDLRANYRQNFQSPPQPSVLQNFQVVRNDSKLTVIDEDGSIYEGPIIGVAGESDKKASGTSVARDELRADASKTFNPVADRSVKNIVFRVAGENRTLNRQVVFEGTNLVLPTTASAFPVLAKSVEEQSQEARRAKPAEKESASAANANQNVIYGCINVGGTNQYKIQAVESSR